MGDVPLRMRTTTIEASPAAMGRYLRRLGDDIERADGHLVLISVSVYPGDGDENPHGEWVVQAVVDLGGGE
jgi:hypothetical protein